MLSDKPGRDFCIAAIRYLEKTVDHDCEMQELGVTGASGSETAADEERGGSNPSATLQLLKWFEILPKYGDWTFGPKDLHSVCSLRHWPSAADYIAGLGCVACRYTVQTASTLVHAVTPVVFCDNMIRCSPHCELLQHIRRVQQVHVLAEACCTLTLAPCHAFDVEISTPLCTTGSFMSRGLGCSGYQTLDITTVALQAVHVLHRQSACLHVSQFHSVPVQSYFSRGQFCTLAGLLYTLTDKAAEVTRLILEVN